MSRIADALEKARGGNDWPVELRPKADAPDATVWATEEELDLRAFEEPRRKPDAQSDAEEHRSTGRTAGNAEGRSPAPAGLGATGRRTAEPATVTARRASARPFDHATRDAVKALTRQLFPAGPTGSVRHVLFASVDDSQASADVVIHVAEALADQVSERVVLVDLDLTQRGFDREFGLQNQVGFSDAVFEGNNLEDFSYPASFPAQLRVVPAGLQGARVRGFLGDPATSRRIGALITAQSYVVAQTAAMTHRDAELLGSLFDGVVLVLQANSTTPQATREAAEAVKASGARLLGTILDNRLP